MLDLFSDSSSVMHCPMFVGGAWYPDGERERIEVQDPADEGIVATVADGTAEDAAEALQAAVAAQPAWAALPPVERGRFVSALANAVRRQAARLARIVIAEQGKPLNQAMGEIAATETFLRHAAENARRIEGDVLPSDNPREEIWIRRQPHGVVVGLTARNYPAALVARKLGPALIAGNTFVLLAHEFTPPSGLELARLADEAGLPAGVFNVVTGRGPVVGQALVESEISNLVTMTGSTRAGTEIYRTGAD